MFLREVWGRLQRMDCTLACTSAGVGIGWKRRVGLRLAEVQLTWIDPVTNNLQMHYQRYQHLDHQRPSHPIPRLSIASN